MLFLIFLLSVHNPKKYLKFFIYEISIKKIFTFYQIIEINITDTNNKIPYALEEKFEYETTILEHSDFGKHIMTIESNDLDRDGMIWFFSLIFYLHLSIISNMSNLLSFKIEMRYFQTTILKGIYKCT